MSSAEGNYVSSSLGLLGVIGHLLPDWCEASSEILDKSLRTRGIIGT